MNTVTIYATLWLVSAIYAFLLARYRHLWEPDLTWLEVVIGVALCLLAPYADMRQNGPLTSEIYEWRVWQAFLIGGMPIVGWQIAQSVRAHLRVERRIRGHRGNTTEDAAAMAAKRRGQPHADD